MLEPLKKSLVDSFAGAIALGWVFAQGILHFANVFSAGFAGWIVRREYSGFMDHVSRSASFSLPDALPDLVRPVCLLALGYILLRGLYFKPINNELPEPTPNPEQAA